jgi:purine-nucleoside/S-methyl-5'-thioadenosine phosphorylase / adenosine deaminase
MLHAYRYAHSTLLRSPALDAIPGVAHAFSTRRGRQGDVSLEGSASGGRSHFLVAARMSGWPLCRVRQVHSNIVHAVEDNGFANAAPEGDALFTRVRGLALSVATADCVPVLVAEQTGRAVASIHAGWRGTSGGITRRTVDAMVQALGVDPVSLTAVIGPHIGVCCMEVGEEVFEWFHDPTVFSRRPEWPRPHLSLAAANRAQLEAAGVPAGSVHVSGLCTRCRADLFHSYRRDGDIAGRMLAVIGLEPV